MKSAAEGSHLVVFPMQKSAPDESGQWKFSASNAQRLHVMTRAEVVEQLTIEDAEIVELWKVLRSPVLSLTCSGELYCDLLDRESVRKSLVKALSTFEIWPKRLPSRPMAKSRPISSCSLYLQSTKSSTGSSMAT